MKKSIKTLIASGVLASTMVAGGIVSTAFAEEEKPTADLSVALLSQYVWRGYELSEDSIVIQPSMTVGYKGFGFNLWGNLDTDYFGMVEGNTTTGGANFNETDVTLSYDGSMDKIGYGVGYIYYALDDGLLDEQEVYVSLSYDTLLSPSLTIYRNFSHTVGWYVLAGISHSVPLTDSISLDLGATASYINFADETEVPDPSDPTDAYSGFHDGVLSASVTVPVAEYISITPSLSYSFPLSGDAKDVLEAANAKGTEITGNADTFYGGVTASLSF